LNAAAVPYRIILTKCDKANQSEIEKTIEKIEAQLKKNPAAFPHPHLTSSDKKIGIDELRAIILESVR
jgi:GTP-binding protein